MRRDDGGFVMPVRADASGGPHLRHTAQAPSSVRRSSPGQPMKTPSWATSGIRQWIAVAAIQRSALWPRWCNAWPIKRAAVAEVGDGLDCLQIDRKDANPIGGLGKLAEPSRTPACFQRSVARLGDRLRRDREQPAEQMLGVLRGERRAPAQPAGEHIRVDEDRACHSSFRAATNASHSSSVKPGIARSSSDVSGGTSAISSSSVGGFRNRTSA